MEYKLQVHWTYKRVQTSSAHNESQKVNKTLTGYHQNPSFSVLPEQKMMLTAGTEIKAEELTTQPWLLYSPQSCALRRVNTSEWLSADKAQAASEGAELSPAEGVEMNSRDYSLTAGHAQNSTTFSKTNERNLSEGHGK